MAGSRAQMHLQNDLKNTNMYYVNLKLIYISYLVKEVNILAFYKVQNHITY